MQANNTVYLNDKQVTGVVVSSDMEGNNRLMGALKFNRLVSLMNARHHFNKNTILVRDTEVKEALIVSDCHGNSTIKTIDETKEDEKERNLFMEALHRVHIQRDQASIDSYLEQKRKSLQEKLEMATNLYLAKNYMKSLVYYSSALTIIDSDSYPDEFRLEKDDIFRIKYALILCNIGAHIYGPLKTACELLNTLILTHGAVYPSLYYTLAQAKIKLILFESARISLEMGVSALDQCTVLYPLMFPASNEVIPDTDPVSLRDKFKAALQLCRNVPRPDVRCCHRMCIADSKAIYFNSPSFIGYVNVTCSERCHFNYHRACWKIKLKTDRVKKPSTILKQKCKTDDCTGVITEIKIYDQGLKVNAAIKAKNDGTYTTSDISNRSDVVESRIYKAQFQLPNPLVHGSNLKPGAAEFNPNRVGNITLRLKNPIKTGPSVFADEERDAYINRQEVKVESSVRPRNVMGNLLFTPEPFEKPIKKVAEIDSCVIDRKIKEEIKNSSNIKQSIPNVSLLFTPESVEKQIKKVIKTDSNVTSSNTKEEFKTVNITNSNTKEEIKSDSTVTNLITKEEIKTDSNLTNSNTKEEVKTVNITNSNTKEEVKKDCSIKQSNLRVNVQEFVPSQVKTQVKKEVTNDSKNRVNFDSHMQPSNLNFSLLLTPERVEKQIKETKTDINITNSKIKEEVKTVSNITDSNTKEEVKKYCNIKHSNLRVNVQEFVPSQVKTPVKTEVKNDSKIKETKEEAKNGSDLNIKEEEARAYNNIILSSLNIDVPEFLPSQVEPQIKEKVKNNSTVTQSNLEVNVLEFIPSQVKSQITDVVKNDSKIEENEVENDSSVTDSNMKEDKNITQSNLKVNVPEFVPSSVEKQIKEVKNDSYVSDLNIKEAVKPDSSVTDLNLKEAVKNDSSVTDSNIKEVKNDSKITDLNIKGVKIDSKITDLNNKEVKNDSKLTDLHIKEVKTDSNIAQSSLKVDVPEFLPSQTNTNTEVNLTKWSTNADSTLESYETATDTVTDYEQPSFQLHSDDNNTKSTEWLVDTALSNLASECTNNEQQTTVEVPAATSADGATSVIQTKHKSISTDPVQTHSIDSQCHVDASSQHTQTEVKLYDINEVQLLKYQVNNLQYALYQAEDANNRLLLHYKQLIKDNQENIAESRTASTQTHEVIDKRQKNCVKWIHVSCTPTICHADILQSTNQKLEEEIKELKISLRLERDCFHNCKLQYCNEISSLKSNISDLESQLAAVKNEFSQYKRNNTMMDVNKILLEQIQCNKNFYLPYLKTYEDKYKHMIWELEDLMSMTTADATPSKSQVEENLMLWRAALFQVEEHQQTIMNDYETLLGNISAQQYTAEFKMPAQKLFVEPPNIILRYFKPVFITNRRLEQDISNQMNGFYKVLGLSQPAMHPPPGLVQYDYPSNADTTTEKQSENTAEYIHSNGNISAVCVEPKIAEKTASSQPANANSTGATPKINKMRQSRSVLEPDTVPQCPQPKPPQTKRPVPDVVGLDALIQKLQSQFPLTDGSVISEALFSIRGRHGGLTGMSSKEIVVQVRKYIRDKQQRTSNSINTPTPITVASPWSTINTPVQWNNVNQDRNCTICFDYMPQKSSVKLKCQHMFHTKCIKIWLQSNSICPICRSFTTLDDEFPPLK